jgi:hypothetical protein
VVIPAALAVMIALPGAIPVTTPSSETLAACVLEELHVASALMSACVPLMLVVAFRLIAEPAASELLLPTIIKTDKEEFEPQPVARNTVKHAAKATKSESAFLTGMRHVSSRSLWARKAPF